MMDLKKNLVLIIFGFSRDKFFDWIIQISQDSAIINILWLKY